ncbi:MAG: GspH/FimT family pseudopilin [Comamonas sp.]|nr:GspH/FimT family pseudopilin [Comamonas sp.]
MELVITLAILAILTAMAAPSFSSLFERWRTAQAVSALESALMYARAESIRRGGGLVLIRHANNSTCTASSTTDWRCGWTLATTADKTTPLQDSGVMFSELTLTISADASEINFDRWGGMTLGSASNFSFSVYPKNRDSSSGQLLCIKSGQISKATSCS